MIKVREEKTPVALTKAEAQALTDRIRGHIDAAWADITKAYEGKAWKALGYSSWEAYVKAEFDISRRRSYQLLDQGRVIGAVAEAAGESVQRVAQISARDVAAIKGNLPEIKEQIRERVERGEDPKKAIDETVAAARAEKERQREERKAQQAEWDRQREENRSKLPPDIQRAEAAKARNGSVHAAVAKPAHVLSLEDRIAELEEANRFLEGEVERLNARIKTFEHLETMYRDWTEGGWEKVVQAKDDLIAELQRTAQARIARESSEKVRNLNAMRHLSKKLEEEGKGRDLYIDIEDAAHG